MAHSTTGNLDAQLDVVIERVRAHWSAKHAAREQALARCRETIRHSALTIRAVHRGEIGPARGLLDAARAHVTAARGVLEEHPDIYHAGFMHDAQKEFAEASITVAMICGEALPTPEELGVEYPAYLNGMGETVGELRRYVLDSLRSGDMERCERFLSAMDSIYAVMVTLDFPDAITGGLRRTTDVTRGILEKTRGDLTISARQRDLERQLAVFQAALSARGTAAPANEPA